MNIVTGTLTVNGKTRAFAGETIEELVATLGADPMRRGIAVAVNAEVVPRAAWARTKTNPGDRIEVVRPLAGG